MAPLPKIHSLFHTNTITFQVHVPYGEFFKSLPVWAVTVAHFSFNWGYYTLLAWLPSYFEMALGLEVRPSYPMFFLLSYSFKSLSSTVQQHVTEDCTGIDLLMGSQTLSQVDKSSFLTLIPYLAMTAMMPLVGPVADGMVDRGVPITTVRKLCQVCALEGRGQHRP